MDHQRIAGAAVVARRLAGFTGWPLLSLVTPLVATPIIARLAGDGWSSIVTAMSIGTFGMSATTWGWSFIGPARVAQAPLAERPGIYAESIRSRLLMSLIVMPLVILATALLATPSMRWQAVLIACAFTLGGMSPQWYCIGVGKPTLLGIFDTLPRVIGTVISVPIMVWTGSILPYPLALIAVMSVTFWLFPHFIFKHGDTAQPFPHFTWSQAWASIQSMTSVASTNLIGVAYAYAPVPLATAMLSSLTSSQFASGDQLYRYALFAVTALGNALQGWTLEIEGLPGRRRQTAAIVLHSLLALLGGGALMALGPWASGLLFGQSVATSFPIAIWYGVAFIFICASTPFLRNLLIPNDGQRLVLVATGVSAVVGLGIMFFGGFNNHAATISAGMAISEALILGIAFVPALRTLNRRYSPTDKA